MDKRIQISFQGGGAKLIELLAAVEALQEIASEREFNISRVAGTSAGSIAATLVAFNKKISSIDSALIQPIIDYLHKSQGVKYLHDDSMLGKASKLSDIFLGNPIVEEDFLPNMIRSLLVAFDIDPDTPIREVPTPIFIAASSMVQRKAIFFSQNNNELNTETVCAALTASCNIPLVFTGFKESRDWRKACVDGGLCENLPVESLSSERNQYGPVIGFCVTSDERSWPPQSAKQYLAHLFDIAINNSVDRAKRIIGTENVHVLISNNTSLDFTKIPSHFRGTKNYNRNKASCTNWLRQRLSVFEKDHQYLSKEISSAPTLAYILEQNGRALRRRIDSQKSFIIDYSAMIAKPYSFKIGVVGRKNKESRRDVLTKAHLIPRQDGFDLIEYPIGISSISDHNVAPTILHVEIVTKCGERRPVGFDLNHFTMTDEVFGQTRSIKKCIITLHEPLKAIGSEISDCEADKLFIWYEQDTECLFRDLHNPNEEFDTLGLQAPKMPGKRIDRIYLAICSNYTSAGVEIDVDPLSAPLTKLRHFADLPSELAFLFDPTEPFHCWLATDVANGKGARLRLKNARREDAGRR